MTWSGSIPVQGSLAPSCLRSSRHPYIAHTLRRPRAALIYAHSSRHGRRAAHVVNADSSSVQSPQSLSPELKAALDNFIQQHKVVLFMKGTKQFPQILQTLNVPFESVNILEDEMLRSGMKEFSQWPTFPQVYINGEFYGGCDIMIEGYQSGELVETLEAALSS